MRNILRRIQNQGRFGVKFVVFERRVPYGRADVFGTKGDIKIYVECGPCRIDKGFNYLREENVELWIVTSELHPDYPGFEKAELFVIKRGKNWEKAIKKYDELWKKKLKKIKNPLDNL